MGVPTPVPLGGGGHTSSTRNQKRRRALPLPVLTARPGRAGGTLLLEPSARPTGWRRERAGRGLGLFLNVPCFQKGGAGLAAPWPPPQRGAGRAGQRGCGRWFPALSRPSPARWRLGAGRERTGSSHPALPCLRFLGTAGPGEGVPGRPQGWLSLAGPVTLAVTRRRRGD